jgi:hypothetical protein
LLDTEAVLLVDDHQSEISELDAVLQKRMGAHNDARLARDHIEEFLAPGGSPLRTSEQGHPSAVVSAAELAAMGELTEHARNRTMMLNSKNFGRRQ